MDTVTLEAETFMHDKQICAPCKSTLLNSATSGQKPHISLQTKLQLPWKISAV